jgi:hypothetical protein
MLVAYTPPTLSSLSMRLFGSTISQFIPSKYCFI